MKKISSKEITLTKSQEQFLLKEFEKTPDLMILIRKCFNNDKLDGRDKEGRVVREFLASHGKDFRTTKREKALDVNLSDDQKEDILRYARENTKMMDICKIIWPDRKIFPLSNEFRSVSSYITSVDPLFLQRVGEDVEYRVPKTLKQLIAKINDVTKELYIEESISEFDKEKFETLGRYLQSPRYLDAMNRIYRLKDDRNLFEAEFIRTIWDKLDLNSDEINTCVSLCMEYISHSKIEQMIVKLNDMMNDVTSDGEGKDIAIRLTEAIKTKSEEKKACTKTQSDIQKALNQTRGERLKQKRDSSANILSLIKAFQIQEERNKMLQIAELQNRAVREEINKIESMNEWKARILGIGKGDVV
jgi:hypothetical protein